MAYDVTHAELEQHLREQLDLLRSGGQAFDGGALHHAKPLATVLRVMLHDTEKSASILGQLGTKSELRFIDTADHINPRNLAPTPGLVMMRMASGAGGSYVAPLDNLAPSRQHPPMPFEEWWSAPVTKDGSGHTFARKDYVLSVSNKEGGAHVSNRLTEKYAGLTRNNSLGWMYEEIAPTGEVMQAAFEGNVALPSVRQIAYEVEKTLVQGLGL